MRNECFTEVARHARHELAWYASVGLGLGVIGLVGAILYTRYGGLGKHSGRLACSTQSLSGKSLIWTWIVQDRSKGFTI